MRKCFLGRRSNKYFSLLFFSAEAALKGETTHEKGIKQDKWERGRR